MKKLIVLFLVLALPILSFAQATVSKEFNVIVLKDENPISKIGSEYHELFRDGIISYFLKRPQFYKVVNREFLDAVKKERAFHKEIGTKVFKEGIDIGGQYLVSCKLIYFSFSTRPVDPLTKQTISNQLFAKEEKNTIVPERICDLEIRTSLTLTSVETGEIIFDKQYPISGTGKGRLEEGALILKAYNNAIRKFHIILDTDLSVQLDQTYNIAEAVKEKNLNFIIITGGTKGGMPTSANLFVHEIIEEEVDGKKVRRDKVIGELKVEKRHGEVSICKIIQKRKEVLKGISAKKNLYCKLVQK